MEALGITIFKKKSLMLATMYINIITSCYNIMAKPFLGRASDHAQVFVVYLLEVPVHGDIASVVLHYHNNLSVSFFCIPLSLSKPAGTSCHTSLLRTAYPYTYLGGEGIQLFKGENYLKQTCCSSTWIFKAIPTTLWGVDTHKTIKI